MSVPPPEMADRELYTAALRQLKSRSTYNYAALGDRVGRPVSTIHGWITGKHLPYARDNADFATVLELLEATHIDQWMNTLYELRDTEKRSDATPSAARRNPYLGLRSFTEDHAELFYGRGALTHRLLALVEDRLTAPRQAGVVAALPPSPLIVTGASGAGKTSVLRAGLVAALNAGTSRVCAAAGGASVAYTTPVDLANVLQPLAEQPDPCCRVVVIDQFEELLADDQRDHLEKAITAIGDACREPSTAVVIGMRADFFDRAIDIPLLRDGLQLGPVIVEAPSTEEATECIVGPARAVGLDVDTELTVRLIDEFSRHAHAHGTTEALPLLSHVLFQLAEDAPDRHLTLRRYHDIGGLARALEGTAEDAHAALSNVGRATCRRLFEQLVQLGDNALPTRRTRQLGDLIGHADTGAALATGQWPELDQVIDTFVGKRLLTLDVDTITISHESLLAAWPRLAEWVDQLRHQLSVLRRIAVSAATWVELDRNPDALLVGSLLDDADALILAAGAPRLSDDQLAYVDASRAARAERRRRDQEVLSRQLAMQSTMLRDIDAALAAQISIIAHQQAPTATTRSALIASTSPLPGGRYLGDPGPTVVAVADDAPVVAVTNSARGTVTIMTVGDTDRAQLTRRAELAVTSPNADAYAVALSPDGTVLAVGGTDRRVTVVDLAHPALDELDADRVLTGPEVIPAPHLTHPAVTVLADDRMQFAGPVHTLTFDADGAALLAGGAAPAWPDGRYAGSEATWLRISTP